GAVGEGDAAELDVVLGRDGDLGAGVEPHVAAAEFHPGFGEDRLVALRLPEGRLQRRRPVFPAGQVAEVAEAAPVIPGRVLAPASDREVLPAAVPAAAAGDHEVV